MKNDKFNDKNLAKAWQEAHKVKDEVGTGFEPEDGRYVVALVMADVGKSKASGRLQITWEYIFLDGEYTGKSYRSYDGLERAEGLPYVMRRIETMGYEAPDAYDELEPLLKRITKDRPLLRITIKTKGEFTNCYVVERVEEQDAPEGWESALGMKGSVVKPATREAAGVETTTGDGEDTNGLEIEEGMQVQCENGDGEKLGVGEILEIDTENEEVIVKIDGKKHIVAFDKLSEPPKEEKKEKTKVKVGRR